MTDEFAGFPSCPIKVSKNGEYGLLELVGVGSSGCVYRGYKKGEQEVGVKVLDLENVQDIDEVTKEIEFLGCLNSPYIIRYHTSLIEGMELWIIMDYASAGSVRKLLEQGALEEKIVAFIIEKVLKALIYLHDTANLIHRDIKSANILLSNTGTVKVCDFGVARKGALKQERSSFAGTLCWMAPEILKRQHYDFKADIWSLGTSVIEMVQGKIPIENEDLSEYLLRVVNRGAPKLSGNFSNELKEFVNSCLNKNPLELLESKFIQKFSETNQNPYYLKYLLTERIRVAQDAAEFAPNLRNVTIKAETTKYWTFGTNTASHKKKMRTSDKNILSEPLNLVDLPIFKDDSYLNLIISKINPGLFSKYLKPLNVASLNTRSELLPEIKYRMQEAAHFSTQICELIKMTK